MINLKDVPINTWILMESTQGLGLSLYFKETDSVFDHGEELLNNFSKEYEFHHWLWSDNVYTKCSIISKSLAKSLILTYSFNNPTT